MSEDTYTGEQGISHVHYQTDVPIAGSEPSASSVLGFILSHFSSTGHNLSKWTACMYSSAKLTEARVRQEVETGSGDVPGSAVELLNLPGTLGAAGTSHLPSALSMWQHYTTSVAARYGRGGTHMPHISNVAVLADNGDFLTTTAVWTNALALGVSIADQINDVFSTTGDVKPIVYSRTRRDRGLSPFTFNLAGAVPSQKARWLRRRMNS